MGKPFTAQEAYIAAQADICTARAMALKEMIAGAPVGGHHNLFRKAMDTLMQRRIDAGELPPLLEKAS
jgi:hypothetical protein